MLLSTKSPAHLLSILKPHPTIKIITPYDVVSVLATDMFVSVLERECIGYEVMIGRGYKDGKECSEDFCVYIDSNFKISRGLVIGLGVKHKIDGYSDEIDDAFNTETTCITDDVYYLMSEYTDCDCNEYSYSILTVFSLIKSLNLKETKTLWPVLIYFSYHEVFYRGRDYKKEQALVKDNCKCNDILLELKYEITENSNLYYKKEVNLPFLFFSNLYLTLKYNLTFLNRINEEKEERDYYLENEINNEKENSKEVNKRKKNRKNNTKKTINGKDNSLNKNNKSPYSSSSVYNKILINTTTTKLKEFLAKSGISLSLAKESYINLQKNVKELIYQILPKNFLFMKKYDNDCILSGLECYYNLIGVLMRRPYLSLRMLHKKEYVSDGVKKQKIDIRGNIIDNNKTGLNHSNLFNKSSSLNNDSSSSKNISFGNNNNSMPFGSENAYFMLMHTFKKNIKNIKQLNHSKILILKELHGDFFDFHLDVSILFISELYNLFLLFFNLLNIKTKFYIIYESIIEGKCFDGYNILVYGRDCLLGKIVDNRGMARIVNKKEIREFLRKC